MSINRNIFFVLNQTFYFFTFTLESIDIGGNVPAVVSPTTVERRSLRKSLHRGKCLNSVEGQENKVGFKK